MSTGNDPGSTRRKKRSTRMGVALIVILVIIGIAVIWGIQRWTEEDIEGPSVNHPDPVALVFSNPGVSAYLAA